jgi:hypothetical protein
VKRTCNYVETILRCWDHSSDARKLTADLTAKWTSEPLRDEATHYTHAMAMVGEVMMHAYAAHDRFRRSAQADLVAPLYAFYKHAQARRRDVVTRHARVVSTWSTLEEQVGKERRECVRAYADLRAAAAELDGAHGADGVREKRERKWRGAREGAVRRFEAFARTWERARGMQESNEAQVMPALVGELESIERDRLAHLDTFMGSFHALFAAWSGDVRQSSELIGKVMPAMQAERSMATLIDKFERQCGPPPPLNPVRYNLPCPARSPLSAHTRLVCLRRCREPWCPRRRPRRPCPDRCPWQPDLSRCRGRRLSLPLPLHPPRCPRPLAQPPLRQVRRRCWPCAAAARRRRRCRPSASPKPPATTSRPLTHCHHRRCRRR